MEPSASVWWRNRYACRANGLLQTGMIMKDGENTGSGWPTRTRWRSHRRRLARSGG